MNFTPTEENYLKAIYHLQAEDGTVTTNHLAQRLNTRPASVTDMMKKLNSKNLLVYKPYYGFSLTNEGKRIAVAVIRRHRLWEYFLSEKLNFKWNEVHSIAEELEHVTSKKLIDKLDEYLGYPRTDPHGDPIPDSRGKIRVTSALPLTELPLHQQAEVAQVINQSEEMLEHLRQKNIGLGTRLEVKKLFEFDHSMELRTKKGTVVITKELARNLYVKKI